MWIRLDERLPEGEDDVLACDWYPDYTKDSFRMHVCSSQADDQYWCGEKTGKKVLCVNNSICPAIGQGHSAYWMHLPAKNDPRWVSFDPEKPPKIGRFYEVLIRLKSGKHYTGFIDSTFCWSPSFNTFKTGSIESIDAYMELPSMPKFIESPKLSEEDEKIKEQKAQAWEEELYKRYQTRKFD